MGCPSHVIASICSSCYKAQDAPGNDADLTEKLNHTYINRRIAQFNNEDAVVFVMDQNNQILGCPVDYKISWRP